MEWDKGKEIGQRKGNKTKEREWRKGMGRVQRNEETNERGGDKGRRRGLRKKWVQDEMWKESLKNQKRKMKEIY